MVTRYLKLFTATLVALFALAACQNERTVDLYGEGGDPNALDVAFTIKDFDVVNLRTHLNPRDEHHIEDLVVWVFDRKGEIVDAPIISHDPKKDFQFAAETSNTDSSDTGSIHNGVPFGGTKTRGQLGGILSLQLKKSGDKVTVVALANFVSNSFTLEDAVSKKPFTSDADFKAVKNIEELKSVRLNYNKRGDNKTMSTERYESPLMYAAQNLTLDDVRNGKVSIELIPYSAKITAKVKPGKGVTINSLRYHFENIPTRTEIFNAIAKSQASISEIKPLPSSTNNMIWSDRNDLNAFIAEGYLVPNYPEPKSRISLEDIKAAQARIKEDGTGYTAFDLRQKRVKEAATGGHVENKEWQFAPDEATALVIDAELTLKDGEKEQRAIVAYTVVLGDFSGLTNESWVQPTDAELEKINNYQIESATHYKYTITINGVNNIIVEAESSDKLDEPNPSAEGVVIGNKPTFQLDSHYEQRTFLLTSTDFDIFKEPNTRELKDDAKLQFMIQTPFEPLRLITYNALEAKKAREKGVPDSKLVDNDWIRIYVHDPAKHNDVFDNNNLPEILYTKTAGDVANGTPVADFWEKTLTVEQFFAWLLENPKPLFDKKNAICITMFIDEYFYQWDPKQIKKADRNRDNADKNLWKKFCNAPDRKFFLFTGDLQVSADQNSRFTEGTYLSVTQHSIKTIFTETKEGIRIWGVESIDEQPNRSFTKNVPGDPAFWYNVYTSNGWSNTWNLLAGDISIPGGGTTAGTEGGWIKGGTNLIMKQRKNTGKGKQDNYWSEMTVGAANGVDMRDEGNYQAVYSPLTRNRDVNRDDKFQASEMKWYIPASSEVMVLALAEALLPTYAKLDVKRTESNRKNYPNAPLVLHSSTMFRNNAVAQTSYNPIVFLPYDFCHVPLLEVLYDASYYNVGPAKYGTAMKDFYSTTRLIRDLGVVEDDVTSIGTTYHMLEGERTENHNTFLKFKPKYADPGSIKVGAKDRTSGEFFSGNLVSGLTRNSFVDGELPTHTEKDASIRIYKKGFKVAGSYAYINSSGATVVERYGLNYVDLKGRLLLRNSPCRGYYEETDKSDLGKWRLPNILELGLMGTAMPRDYWFNTLEGENGTVKKTVWSATTPSFAAPRSRSTFQNLFLYLDQQIFWTMNFKENNFGEPASKSTWKGYVRCVRDIE
ncbi:DUF4906 domain-containing protein [Porphyromonas somerae]|nr:DUF4906 domain-containing protein [Porphyromonas somerae]